MIGEIAILIKTLDTAFGLIQRGLESKRQITEIGNEIDHFFESKEKLEEGLEEERNKTTRSPIQQAMFEEQIKAKTEKYMSVLAAEYSRQGKSHIWEGVKRNALAIERDRAFETNFRKNRAKAKQQQKSDVIFTIKLFVGLLMILAGIFGTAFYIIGE